MVFTTKKFVIDSPMSNMTKFLEKRIIRIAPLYFILTFAWMIMGRNFSAYFSGELFSRLWHSLLFLPYKDTPPVLFLGWSLNYEMFFYLIFALSFFLKNKRYTFIIAFFCLVMIIGKILDPKSAYLKMVTGLINIHFILGIIIGLSVDRIKLIPKNIALLLTIFGIILFSLFYFNIITIQLPILTALIVGLFVLAFIVLDVTIKFKPNRFFYFLGDISFSIYLIHPFVEVVFRRFHFISPLQILLLFFTQIILVILLSKVSYEVIEIRLTNYLKNKLLK